MIIKRLFLSLKEILIVMGIQYFIVIISILLLGYNSSIVWGTVFLMIFDIIYIVSKLKIIDVSFNIKNNYFHFLLFLLIYNLYNTPLLNPIYSINLLNSM